MFFEQTEFYRDGARTKHTETELAECEKRRVRRTGRVEKSGIAPKLKLTKYGATLE